MRFVFGLVLLIGVALAGGAVYVAQGYIDQYETELAAEREALAQRVTVKEIYVAAAPLRYGDILLPEHVKLVRFPEESMPEGAFFDEATLFPNGNAEARVVLRAIEVNEPVLSTKVTEPGEEAGVATFLEAGRRAFTINVDVTSGVSGFLSPGDRVDVFWSGDINGRSATQLIKPGVKIVAIDQSADQDRLEPTIARTVTVEVSPTDVASLAQAQATGRLSLALVGVADTTAIEGTIEVDQRALLGIQEDIVEEVQQEEICTIKTRRAGELVDVVIPCTN